MNEKVNEELDRWLTMFNRLEGCSVEKQNTAEGRWMVKNLNPVPWQANLHAQYNESAHKIGYLHAQKKGIKIDLDMPHKNFSQGSVQAAIDPAQSLPYSPPEERAPSGSAYWRFRSMAHFDTITLSIKDPYFGAMNTESEVLQDLFQQIVDDANGS